MSVQLITYDLRRPGQDYSGLHSAIRTLGAWWHCVESVWVVKTPLGSAQVLDRLRSHIDANDSLVVTALGGDWATIGLTDDCANWFRTNLAA
jgi:hypothetical protein